MRKPGLLSSCAAGTILVALAAPAAAQSFLGAPTVVQGGAVITTGPGVTDILVSTPEAVIDWQAFDPSPTGFFNFQPGGIATFDGDPAVQDYTVLNRILPVDGLGILTTSIVEFHGTVQSFLKGVPGGNIWFFSPNGIIVGPTAVFNVGSLILTTNDIPFPAGGSLYGPGGLVQLIGPAGSNGYVEVRPLAQLNANGANAYLALVAPRVVQGGTVRANGHIAYLAAEQVDMTINGGLFDFVLTVGTEDDNGVVHAATGTTTGPASTGAADIQRMAMIALPKNDAVTMLLAGSIGYAPAALAINEGSSVVLAAGFDTPKPTAVPGNTLGSIDIGNATFRNRLNAFASDAIGVAPVAGTAAFQANAALYGRNAAGITAETGEQVTATNDLLLRSGAPGAGGAIDVRALGTGLVNIAGTLGADASSGAAVFVAFPGYLDATGGTVAITADGGTINALNLVAGADAIGNFGDSRGGIATGGTVGLTISNGGTVTADVLSLTANALGGPSARSGGDGTGGAANLTVNAGALTATTLAIESNGAGGSPSASPVATPYQAGHGGGGTSGFAQNGGTANVTTLTLRSDGTGGEPGVPATGADLAALAGNGTGGTSLLRLAGGALTTTDTTLRALGTGADGMGHAGAGAASDGGIGTGGTARLLSAAGSTNTFAATTLTILANGQGGDGGISAAGASGNGGNGAGFSAAADFADGALTLGAVTLQSTGTGGFGVIGGEGSGAQARFAVIDTGAPFGTRGIGSLDIDTSGFGNAGADSDAGSIDLTAQVFDAASALDFTGDLTLTNTGTRSAVGNGIAVTVGGAPLAIGGNIAANTTRDALVTAAQPLRAVGNIDFVSRAFTAAGLVDADGTLSIVAPDGITAERLESGGITLLQADNGPVTVTTDLASAGDVTALGRSVDITALGALSVANAQGTAGNVRIVTGGDLTANLAQATGTVTLTSGGGFIAAGPVTSGGAVTLMGNTGLSAGTVTSGATTLLQSPNGAVLVGDLASAGAVTALGRSVDVTSPGSLTFADLDATAGDAFVNAQDDLTFATVDATGAIHLTTGAGNILSGSLTAGTWAYVGAAGGSTLGDIVAGIDVGVSTFGGNLTVGNVTAGDEIWLSVFGAVPTRVLTAGNLVSTGLGDDAAAGPPILFGGPGPTGNVTRVRSSGSLAVGNVQTPGRAILVADNGIMAAGTVNAPGGAILLGRGNIALAGATTAGKFYVADSAMFGVLPPADYDPASLDGMAPVDTSGNLSVTGAVSAGTVSVAVGGNLTIAGLTSAGTTLLRATGGAVDVDNLLSAGAVTALGRSVDLVSTGALTFADLEATAGSLSVLTAGNLGLAAADATGAVTLRSTGGAIASTGAVNAGGSVSLNGLAGVTVPVLNSGSTTQLQAANGTVDIDALTSPGAVSVTAAGIDIGSPGALTFATAQAANAMAIAAAGNLAFGAAGAGGNLALTSTGGSVTATGAVTAGGNAAIVAPLGITLPSLGSGGTTLLRATGGTVDIDNLLSAGLVTASGRSVDLASTGALTFADLDATAGALSVLTAGNLTLATADATGAIALRSTGGALRSTGGVNGASIALTANGAVQADANLAAAGNLAIDAGGTFTLAGIGRGTVIGVRSSDIALGGAAGIGVRGVTQDVTLTNANPARVTFIGGAADPAGYSLDQAEIPRVFADRSITLVSAGDMTIRDLALTFGGIGNIGTGGRLEVTTPARVSITGNVALTTSGADDSFVIDPTRIELNTDTGSIALLNGAGNPLGRLAMTGNTIAVATAGVLGQVAAAPSFATINGLLDQPGGNPQPLRAGTMTFTASQGLYIQNSGISALFRDRAGFTATSLAINTASANTQIAINGRILTAGGPVTGLNTQPLVTINGAPAAAGGQFDPRSTINGCLIGGTCAPPPGSGAPSDSELVGPLPSDAGAPSLVVAPMIELAATEPLITPPLVDEPITGVGNDDLWEPRCEPGEEDSTCPEQDGQP